jgi:excisionase family DNA binding protein
MPLTARQAADYLGIGEAVLRRLCRTGCLRGFKAGGQWRVYPEDITAYILKQLQKS